MPSSPPVWRPTTEAELRVLRALKSCSMLPGSHEKRFVRDMQGAKRISQYGAGYLAAIRQRYRRQLPPEIMSLELEHERDPERA